MNSASNFQIVGAFGFGLLIGWYVYYINRYRKSEVQLSDLVTLIGVLGGGAILVIFPAKSDLFGAYGLGLATGYFLYFLALVILVSKSDNFTSDWFLDGRRKRPIEPFCIPDDDTQHPMAMEPGQVKR